MTGRERKESVLAWRQSLALYNIRNQHNAQQEQEILMAIRSIRSRPRVKSARDTREITERVASFLAENPELEAVTFRRVPDKPQRYVYNSAHQESFGRMPESCPILREAIDETLIDGETITEELRSKLFSRIHDEVTDKFRDALTFSLEQKYEAIKTLRAMNEQIEKCIEEVETTRHDAPPAQDPRAEAMHSLARPVLVVDDIGDMEDDE